MSKSAWTRTPVSRPSASAPNVAVIRAGWRFGRRGHRLRPRIDAPGPGARAASAAIAISGCSDRSSLPPNPPPQALGMTRTRSVGQAEDQGQLVAVHVRRLGGGEDLDAPVDRRGAVARLGLDVGVLDVGGLERPGRGRGGRGQGGVDVAQPHDGPRSRMFPGEASWSRARARRRARRRSRAAAGSGVHAIGSSSSRDAPRSSAVADEREHGLAAVAARSPRRAPAGPCRSRRSRSGCRPGTSAAARTRTRPGWRALERREVADA